jgi:hypothetical protein
MSHMAIRNWLGGLSAAALAAMLCVSLTATAQAYQCKTGFTQAEALHKSATKSRAAARKAWSTTAKNSYGLEWSLWNIATAKDQNCSHTGAAYYCIVKAKPCLYVVQ